jgi:hypothetical protein
MFRRLTPAAFLGLLLVMPGASHAGFIFGTSNIPSSDNVNFATNTNVTSFTGMTSQTNITMLFNNPNSGTTLDTNNGQTVSIDSGSPQVWTTLTATVQTFGVGLKGIDLKLQPHNSVTTDGSADWVNLTVFGPGAPVAGVTSPNLNFQTSSGQSDFTVSATGNDSITKLIWTVHFGATNNIDSQKQFSIIGGTAAIPEPSSLLMACLAGGTLGVNYGASRLVGRKRS